MQKEKNKAEGWKQVLMLGSFVAGMIALLGAYVNTYSMGDRVAIFWDIALGNMREALVPIGLIVVLVVILWFVRWIKD